MEPSEKVCYGSPTMSYDLVVPPSPGPLAKSLGDLHVLCVGVSKQLPASGFRSLPQCEHDALAVRDAFADVFQLGAQARNVSQLTSKAATVAKGSIIDALRQLATAASDSDRILFFFSGHGQRLGDKLYLVPEDAWDSDDPEALIEFDRVLEILNGSKARQKFIVLDACWSGPDVTHIKKFVPSSLSKKFLEDYLSRTTGFFILTSSSDSQTSTTQSPNPKLSLFTHHFVAALRGHPDALDDRFLTLQKLFEYVSVNVQRDSKSYHKLQEPVLRMSASGSPVLGDFRPIINPAGLGEYPIDTIYCVEIEDLRVTDVLRNIKKWTYSMEYLAAKVNTQLGDHYEERFGRLAARLRNEVEISSSDIRARVKQGKSIRFLVPKPVESYIYFRKLYG